MKKLLIVVVWVIFIGILFGNTIYLRESLLVNLTTIIGWFLFASQFTVNHSERMYLFVKRLWFFLWNPSCLWNIQAELKGTFDTSIFDKLDKELRGTVPSSYKIIRISNTRRQYHLQEINIEVVLNENVINLYIHDMKVSFRDSIDTIDRKLAHIFETIQYVAKADTGEYGMQVNFNGYNPYFSFFIRRLNAKDIQQYNISFKVDDEHVYVSNSSIEITADSFNKLNQISKSYLALANPH